MSDNDISEADKKYLIKQLTKSAELRDKFIEYENFETLSYKAMNDPLIEKKEAPEPVEENLPDILKPEEISLDENIIGVPTVEETIEEVPVTEELIGEDITAEPLDIEENVIDEPFAIEEEIPTEEPVLDGIDFEALEIPETVETFEEPALEGISLDAVELPIEEDTATEPLIDETISLDAIELPQEETIIEEPMAELLSFDDVEPLQTEEVTTETPVEDILSFDAIEPLQEELPPVEETPMMAFEELTETTDTTQEEVMPFEESAFEISDIIEPSVDVPPVTDDIIDSLPFESDEEEPVQSEDSSFGKNLLENLSEEHIDDVEIENYNQDDISSQDLLSQIDDVLSTSSTVSDDVIPADSIDDILNETEDLNVLYNEETTAEEQPSIPEPEGEAEPQVPGAALYNSKKSSDKKSLITAGALIAVLAGASAFYFLKPKDTAADIEPLPVNRQASEVTQNTSDDILASNTPTPQAPVKKDIEASKPVVKELKNNPPKPVKSESYLDVNRLVWDVPDALSYSPKIQSYLRTAGRSIKLSLSADLLLATEYAYTNQVKVGLKLSKNGSVQDARILSGSGSTQIDNIVLQSVKDTLNVVKPPADEIKTPDFNLNLIIYF